MVSAEKTSPGAIGGILGLAAPLVRRMGRRQERAIWTGLKHLLEGRPAPAGDAAEELPSAIPRG